MVHTTNIDTHAPASMRAVVHPSTFFYVCCMNDVVMSMSMSVLSCSCRTDVFLMSGVRSAHEWGDVLMYGDHQHTSHSCAFGGHVTSLT
jgi:hypothetical protein